MVTVVERKNQTRRIITFSSPLICKISIKISQIMNENDGKIKRKYKHEIYSLSDNKHCLSRRANLKLSDGVYGTLRLFH